MAFAVPTYVGTIIRQLQTLFRKKKYPKEKTLLGNPFDGNMYESGQVGLVDSRLGDYLKIPALR